MGHHISAIVCKPSEKIGLLADFDLTILREGEFVIIPMDASHTDAWTEKLGLGFGQSQSELIVDGSFARCVGDLGAAGDFALIETNYFGGVGDQSAVVYRKGVEAPLFTSKSEEPGPINEALRRVGVIASTGRDEFDTLGLGACRNFEDYFEKYWGS